MKKAEIRLETLTCPSCLMKINKAVRTMNGVDKKTVDVLFNSSRVKFDFDDQVLNIKDVEEKIEQTGYKVLSSRVK